MEAGDGRNPRIINCHTHVFTGGSVPPRLGRTFLPLGLHWVFTIPLIVNAANWYYKSSFIAWLKQYKKSHIFQGIFWISWFIRRWDLTALLASAVGYWFTIHTFFYLYEFVSKITTENNGSDQVVKISKWFKESHLFLHTDNLWLRTLIVGFVLLFFPSGRNLLFFIFKQLYRFLAAIPGKQTRDYFARYLNLGRFALYKNQSRIYSRLAKQYPPGSGFVILPMDMEFMGAGKPKIEFKVQMEELIALKNRKANSENIFPFVFIHPERMKDESFFKYTVSDGHVKLDASCDLYRYMETESFSGFKIYPALGYYPFDEQLLPLWRYAAERQIPIMTHCILGTIFYRGRKKMEWNKHPVFEEPKSKNRDDHANRTSVDEELGQDIDDDETESDAFMSLNLHQLDNTDFQRNFTHPLNYLCLLDDDLLYKTIKKYNNSKLEEAFGLKDDEMEYNLNNLKICLGHFGGDDEWKKYFELDRQNHVHQLMQKPMEGIDFFETNGKPKRGKIAQLWGDGVDWYSIICSLMLRYPNVYGDISYIINNPDIFPLLKYTLREDNTRLRQRVLFGTDFYVVRNHKTEREMLVESQAWLTEEEFDLIARYNPLRYLAIKRNTQGTNSEVA